MSFLAPKAPTPAPLPAPPAPEDTAAKQRQYEDMLRQRRGRAAAILSQRGDLPATASKTLLGG